MNIKEKLQAYKRILRIAKKPSGREFKAIVKVTGLGIILIGFIGFLINIAVRLLGAL
jgi:protein transport protein SEC61 subunit gamma-like protein